MPRRTPDAAPATFGRRLRDLRTAAGLSVAALAERASITRQHVGWLESDRSSPTWDVVQRLAAALDATPNDFR